MPFRQGLPSCPPSLSQLGLGCGSLIPGVSGTPLVSRASVPVSRYLLKTSSSRTIPIVSSSTNSKFDGLLRDSEKIRCATPLLCLAEGPICSGGPNSPFYGAHRLSFNDCLSLSAGCSFPGACLTFFSLYTIKRSTWTGPRVVPNWAWTSTLPDLVVSPQTRISDGFTGAFNLRVIAYSVVKKFLLVDSPRPFPFSSSTLVSMLSIGSSFTTGLLSCVAVSVRLCREASIDASKPCLESAVIFF
ncbi:hypothetical protein Bca4012_022411 [Brassica carinata]